MVNELLGPILSEIGGLLEEDVRGGPDGAFLYAEAEENWVSVSLFIDVGDRVMYRHASSELERLVLDLWEAAEPDKKWNALFYTLTGERFHANFQYEEGWDSEAHGMDRRTQMLAEKYGDKPVDYSDP